MEKGSETGNGKALAEWILSEMVPEEQRVEFKVNDDGLMNMWWCACEM